MGCWSAGQVQCPSPKHNEQAIFEAFQLGAAELGFEALRRCHVTNAARGQKQLSRPVAPTPPAALRLPGEPGDQALPSIGPASAVVQGAVQLPAQALGGFVPVRPEAWLLAGCA